MPRRRVAAKRQILPDPIFKNLLIAKFVNCVMKHGKKSTAERIVYGALEKVNERSKSHAKKDEEGGDSSGSGERGKGGRRLGKSSSGETKEPSLELFSRALENIQPTVEVRARRVGGATYQIPVEVRQSRRIALAMRWLVESAKDCAGKSMAERLAGEILDALQNRGNAVKKRETTHAMAKANQAFAHFRW